MEWMAQGLCSLPNGSCLSSLYILDSSLMENSRLGTLVVCRLFLGTPVLGIGGNIV